MTQCTVTEGFLEKRPHADHFPLPTSPTKYHFSCTQMLPRQKFSLKISKKSKILGLSLIFISFSNTRIPSSNASMKMLSNIQVLYHSKPKAPKRDFFPWQDKIGFQEKWFFPAACESSSYRANTALAQSHYALVIFVACESIVKNTQSCASTLLQPE